MKKIVFNVMMITIIAKVLGFARTILLSYFFGASGISDAYLVSQTIPGTIFQFIGTGLATSFIPVYLSVVNRKDERTANRFTNTVLTLVFIFSTIIIVLVCLYTSVFVRAFASGFTGETLEKAIYFTRVNIFSLYFSATIYVVSSYLQLKNKFAFVAFTAIPNALIIMISIFLGARVNLNWLPIGSILAVLLQAVLLIHQSRKQHFTIRLSTNFKDNNVKKLAKLMGPVTIGVTINEINLVVNKTIASQLAIGGISALTYAESLVLFVQGIFAQTIATVYYPQLTNLAEEGNEKGLKSKFNEAVKGMVCILAPVTVGCILLAEDIIRVLYDRGGFDEIALRMTSSALLLYGVGILGYGFREMLARVFYAYHDTKTPMINAGIGAVINIVMSLILSPIMGVGGLALATSVSSIVTSLLLVFQLQKRLGRILPHGQLQMYVKIVVATLIMGVVVFVMSRICLASANVLTTLGVGVLTGVIVYVASLFWLKVDVAIEMWKLLVARRMK